CVEPDPQFFRYLQHNCEAIRRAHPQADIQLVQALVGESVSHAVLAGGGGSRHSEVLSAEQLARLSETQGLVHRSVSLDAIAASLPPSAPVSLLKSDVDGYDHDVLASARSLLRTQRPILFF